jgi:putative DNA primase/helicase
MSWWTQWPAANIGIVTGSESGLFVIDFDADCELPECLRELPNTITAFSSRGSHIYLRYPSGRTIGNRTKVGGLPIDVRGDGGYIVSPPSVHPSGAVYTWQNSPADYPLADAPVAVLDWIESAHTHNGNGRRHRRAAPIPQVIPEGQRDDTLASMAGTMRRRGLGEHEIFDALQVTNRRCVPPLADGDLGRIARSVSKYAPSPNGTHKGDDDIHLTDLGNARRLVKDNGRDIRYCHPLQCWYVWDGRRWREDDTAEAVRRVKETQGRLFRETAEQIKGLAGFDPDKLGLDADGDDRKGLIAKLKQLLDHCLRWEGAPRIAACLELARSEPGVAILPSQLDTDPCLLNVVNGTIDLRTGQLREHRREDYLSKLAPVTYDPNAQCPLWGRCLKRWMGDKDDLVGYLQRVTGYSLTGDISEHCLWFFYGLGENGKSTFLGTILAMLGDYGIQAISDLLLQKRSETHPTERADLFGRRFVATIETDEGRHMAESLMKQMTGGDRIRARRMYKDFFEFDATHKIFLAANHKPNIRGTDWGVWRRIKLVPFTVTITAEEKIKDLGNKLKAEFPGILNWAVRGCLDWQRGGLGEPDEVRLASEAYRAEQDLIARWIAECCNVHPDLRCTFGALFDSYQTWSGDKVMTAKGFGQRLDAEGYHSDPRRGHGGVKMRLGLALATSEIADGVTDGD